MKNEMKNTLALNSKLRKFCVRWTPAILFPCVSFPFIGTSVQVFTDTGSVCELMISIVIVVAMGVYGLVLSLTDSKRKRRYEISQWASAIREQYGKEASITLRPDDTVHVESAGQVLSFPTMTDAIRYPK